MHTRRRDASVRRRHAAHGFTLIELLVVITIIVVLLALLAPALDKAIYQAELAVCGAGQKGIAGGATVYAVDHGRAYPYRETLANGEGRSIKLYDGNAGAEDRRRLMGYIQIKSLMDPLSDRAIDISPDRTLPDSHVYSNYNLWFGHGVHGGGKMNRLGDRMSHDQGQITHHFDLLVGDSDAIEYGSFLMQGSHPDAAGALRAESRQDEKFDGLTPGGLIGARWTYSFWVYPGNTGQPPARGAVDANYGRADGSVQRLTELRWDKDFIRHDERLIRIDTWPNGQNPNFSDHLPIR